MTRRALPVFTLFLVVLSMLFVQVGEAQMEGVSLPSTTTIAVLVLLSLIATLLIAFRFKWIEVSLSRPSGWPARVTPTVSGRESTVELSHEFLGRVRQELELTRDLLAHQKDSLLTERDRLREARSEAREDTQGYFEAMAELKRSRAQVEQLSLELARVQERFTLAREENQRIRAELQKQQAELEEFRSRLTSERGEIERLQIEVQRERAEVEKAFGEIAKEWELLRIRREEIEQARKDLFESVGALTKSREQLVAEIQASASLWRTT